MIWLESRRLNRLLADQSVDSNGDVNHPAGKSESALQIVSVFGVESSTDEKHAVKRRHYSYLAAASKTTESNR